MSNFKHALKRNVMKKSLALIVFVSLFIIAHAQEVKPLNLKLISKKSNVQIWMNIDIDTSYYLVFMNYEYEVLKDQSITKLTKQQLKDFAALIQKMAENVPGEYQAKTEYGLLLIMDKGEKSYWLTIYDSAHRWIKMKTNLTNILLKDISLQ